MAPTPLRTLLATAQHASETKSTFSAVRLQWRSPNDLLTILMVIGGDIVQRALAQLAGDPPLPYLSFSVAPVAFSFGWVAYAFMAILSVIGDGRMMPMPESQVTLMNIETGHSRTNRSWVLARLFRDFHSKKRHEVHEGLAVHFYHVSKDKSPSRDWVWWLGAATIVVQLGISVIPGACDGNWMILIIIAGGTILALWTSALPQWHNEKWSARNLKEGARRVICLTAGNGSQDVLVVICNGGLRLEDLAAGRHEPGWSNAVTLYSNFALALLWLVHLITVEAVQDGAWYLLAAGGIGMIQNVIAAGGRRTPTALGIHLVKDHTCQNKKVFAALQSAEDHEPGTGLGLVPIFFPGGLRPSEEKWVSQRKAAKAMAGTSPSEPESGDPHVPKCEASFDAEKIKSPDGTLVGESASSSISEKLAIDKDRGYFSDRTTQSPCPTLDYRPSSGELSRPESV